jgi:hypothetical protein
MTMLETRLDRIELALEQFIRQTNLAMTNIDRNIAELKTQAEKDREEARRDRAEAEARAERDREEARRERRELARQLGDISNRLGTIVEDPIAPSLSRMLNVEFNCGPLEFFGRRIVKVHPRTRLRREFDVIAVGEKAALLNETKAVVRPEYIKEAVEFLKSGEFFEYFPEYAGKPLIPVCSSFYLSDELVTYLTRNGIYAVAMGDEAMAVLNLEAVRAQHTTTN